MEEAMKEINPKLNEVDILYEILKKGKLAQNFRQLMQQACEIKGTPVEDPQLMASIHTQLILDSRFNFLGHGNWGLKEWTQNKINRRTVTSSTTSGRTVAFQHLSMQDDLETSETEYSNKYSNKHLEEDDDWEE